MSYLKIQILHMTSSGIIRTRLAVSGIIEVYLKILLVINCITNPTVRYDYFGFEYV